MNMVSSLHSYMKETYNHYRGVANKYINRYNALFSVAFRCTDGIYHLQFQTVQPFRELLIMENVKNTVSEQSGIVSVSQMLT